VKASGINWLRKNTSRGIWHRSGCKAAGLFGGQRCCEEGLRRTVRARYPGCPGIELLTGPAFASLRSGFSACCLGNMTPILSSDGVAAPLQHLHPLCDAQGERPPLLSEKGSRVRESIPLSRWAGDGRLAGGFSRPLSSGRRRGVFSNLESHAKGDRSRMLVADAPSQGTVKEGGTARAGQTTGGRNLDRDIRGLDRVAVAKSRRLTAKPFRLALVTVRARHALRRAGQHLYFGP